MLQERVAGRDMANKEIGWIPPTLSGFCANGVTAR
jgi:hypothetical protein